MKIKLCDDGVNNLRLAIVDRACKDYREGYYWRKDVECFFRSQYGTMICGELRVSEVLSALKAQAEYKQWRSIIRCTRCKESRCEHFGRINPPKKRNGDWVCIKGRTVKSMKEIENKKLKNTPWKDGKVMMEHDFDKRKVGQEARQKYMGVMNLYFKRYDKLTEKDIKAFIEGIAKRHPIEVLKWYVKAVNFYCRAVKRPDLIIKWGSMGIIWN